MKIAWSWKDGSPTRPIGFVTASTDVGGERYEVSQAYLGRYRKKSNQKKAGIERGLREALARKVAEAIRLWPMRAVRPEEQS